jgi:glutaconyl-CoA/methylmalonyl-CoA decarboxylase subunit gamma
MKKFKFNIKGTDYDVNVKKVVDNVAEIEVNGTTYKVEIDKKIHRQKHLLL